MSSDTSVEGPNEKPDRSRLVIRWLIRAAVLTLIMAASLFVPAGRLDWTMAWLYIGVFVAGRGITGLVLIPSNPELVAERTQLKADKRDLDRVLAGIIFLYGPVSTWVVAGLDVGSGWSSEVSSVLQFVALAVVVLGTLLTIWAMASNRFFYGTLRIEKERGHTVATTGPYQYVRHPGYVGGSLFTLATPLVLGSLWAFVPAGLTLCVYVVRTALEDRTLQNELDGYKEYAQRVRYRLLPGVW
jgi:protein-S-isoprenylcysteine O-methyltransferase Ste14